MRLLVCVALATFGSGLSPEPLEAADYVPPSQFATVPLSNFAGYYIAGGGGLAVGEQRQFTMTFGNSGDQTVLTPHGWLGAIATGYNVQISSFLIGLELGARGGNEEGSKALLPFKSFSLGQITPQYRFRSDAGFNVSARVGAAFANTLVFGKFGLGMAHTEDSFTWTGSGEICTTSNPAGACLASVPAPSASIINSKWTPSLVGGLGLEQNFGLFFVRAGAEIEGIKSVNYFNQSQPAPPFIFNASLFGSNGTSDFYWIARATGMVGIRF